MYKNLIYFYKLINDNTIIKWKCEIVVKSTNIFYVKQRIYIGYIKWKISYWGLQPLVISETQEHPVFLIISKAGDQDSRKYSLQKNVIKELLLCSMH